MFKEQFLQPEAVIEELKRQLGEAEYRATVNSFIVENFRQTMANLAAKYPEIRKELEENGKPQSGREQETRTNNSNTAETKR